MGAVFTAVAFCIRLVNTGTSLVVAQVVATLGVSGCPMQERTSGQTQHKQNAHGDKETRLV